MAQHFRINLKHTLKSNVLAVHAFKTRFITFDLHSTEIWQLSPDDTGVGHRVALSPPIDDPGREGVFIDEELETIVIQSVNSQTPALSVYGLRDGQLIRKVPLFGDLQVSGMQYRNGRALVAVDEYDTDSPPNKSTTLLLCDLARDGGILRRFRLPLDLAERDVTSPDDSFVPLMLTTNGDVAATSSAYYDDTMSIILWKEADSSQYNRNEQPPSRVIEMPLFLSGGDSIRPSSSTSLDDGSFLVSAYEHVMDCLETAGGAQSIIHLLGTASLDEIWFSDPIWGRIHTMRYVASHDVVIAIGNTDEREDGGEYDWATVVAALDAKTGALRRTNKINFRKQGSSVEYCDVSQINEAAPELVVLFKNGNINITSLDCFLSDGFARNGESVKISRIFPDTVEMSSGAVAGHSALLVTGDSDLSLASW